MPKQNFLFHFLNAEIPALHDLNIQLKQTNPSASRRTYARAYYQLIPLPIEENSKLLNYTLIKHHLSIFETPYIQHQYHYTAYMSLGDKEFILHAYFNKHDQILQICLRNENHYVMLEQEEFRLFEDFAMMQSAPIMSIIKTVLNKTIEEEEKILIAKMNIIFNFNPENTHDLLTLINEALPLAQKLAQIGQDVHYSVLLKYKNALEWQIADFEQSRLVEAEKVKAIPIEKMVTIEESEEEDHYLMQITADFFMADEDPIEEIATAEDRDIDTIMRDFHREKEKLAQEQQILSELPSATSLNIRLEQKQKVAKAIASYYSIAIAAKATLYTCLNSQKISENWVIIHQALNDLKPLGINALKEAILMGSYPTMGFLKEFTPYLDQDLLIRCISTDKRKKIEFLLQHGSFCLNQIQVPYEAKTISLLEFAFRKKSITAFNLLLKHGASLLAHLPQRHSFLFKIFLDPITHKDFYQAISETLGGKGVLILIKSWLPTLNTLFELAEDEQERLHLKTMIDYFKNFTQFSLVSDKRIQRKGTQINGEVLKLVQDLGFNIPDEMRLEIYSDPEGFRIIQDLAYYSNMLTEIATPQQINTLLEKTKQLNEIGQALLASGLKIGFTYQKDHIISILRAQRNMFQEIPEIFYCQNQLKHTSLTKKEAKRLVNRIVVAKEKLTEAQENFFSAVRKVINIDFESEDKETNYLEDIFADLFDDYSDILLAEEEATSSSRELTPDEEEEKKKREAFAARISRLGLLGTGQLTAEEKEQVKALQGRVSERCLAVEQNKALALPF